MSRIVLDAIIILFPVYTIAITVDQYVKFESIEYPEEIILSSKDFEKELTKKKLIIKYKYLGEDFMSDICKKGKYSCTRTYDIDGMIFYLDKHGHFLPAAFNYYKQHGLKVFFYSELISGYLGSSGLGIFKKNDLNIIEMNIFDPFCYIKDKETGIIESIKSQRISAILVIIKDVKIFLELSQDGEEIKKGKFKIEINKVLNIKVKYRN